MTTNIFDLENFEDFSEKINMDELFEKKKQKDLDQLNLYNKVLNRVHVKIKTTSRQKKDEQHCWFVVPEVIMGVPRYDQGACIAYLVDKLETNGFSVKYIHPNVIFICWKYWVPSYVRDQLKKKAGIRVNEFGKPIKDDGQSSNDKDSNETMTLSLGKSGDTSGASNSQTATKKVFNSTKNYKPTGKLVYNDDLIDLLGNKMS
tara:strand:+ start:2925 stop:3533 length:609 start_codon:yes stop_codon:yes gene_type:complete